MISNSEKTEIYAGAMRQLGDWYGPNFAEQGVCLYLTQVAMRELITRGHNPQLMAGDLMWRIVPHHLDDGQSATHWGYEWSPDQPFSKQARLEGKFPECHVWCVVDSCVVDFSTGFLPRLAANMGFDWATEKPPQYVFGEPPEDAIYRPRLEAVRFTWEFILTKMANNKPAELIPA